MIELLNYTSAHLAPEAMPGHQVVLFHAEWCLPCVHMKVKLRRVYEQMNGPIFAIFNIEKDRAFVKTLSVTSIPTIIWFKDGKELGRIEGALTKESIIKTTQWYIDHS